MTRVESSSTFKSCTTAGDGGGGEVVVSGGDGGGGGWESPRWHWHKKCLHIYAVYEDFVCVKNVSVGKSVAARISEGQLTVSEDECNYL